MAGPREPPRQLPELVEVVERLGFGWGQVYTILLAGGTYAADGAELLLIGAITRSVSKEWGLHAMERGLVVSVVFAGVLLGNFSGGPLGDHWGRRFPILLCLAGVFIFSLLSTAAFDFYSLACIRFFVGAAFGVGLPGCNSLTSELTPRDKRLMTTSLNQVVFSLGELYSAFLIYRMDPRMKHLESWRTLVILGALPSLVFGVLAFFFLLESPSFLALQPGRKQEAVAELESLRRANFGKEAGGAGRENGDAVVVDVEFQSPRRPAPVQSGFSVVWEKLKVVYGRKLRFSTLVLCYTTFTLNFLYYGGMYALPQVLPDLDLRLSPAVVLMLGALAEIPGALCAIPVGFYLSRKSSMQVYLFGAFWTTVIFSVSATATAASAGTNPPPYWLELSVLFAVVFNKFFIYLGFSVVYQYSVELYPTVARTTGTACCLASGRLGSMFCSPTFEYLEDESTGSHARYFQLTAGLALANMVLVAFLPFETKGVYLQDHLEEEEDDARSPLIRP